MTNQEFQARVESLIEQNKRKHPKSVIDTDTSDVQAYPRNWWRSEPRPEAIEGTGQVEYASTEAADQDEAEGWPEAKELLDRECRDRFGGETAREWLFVNRDGRWVKFIAR